VLIKEHKYALLQYLFQLEWPNLCYTAFLHTDILNLRKQKCA